MRRQRVADTEVTSRRTVVHKEASNRPEVVTELCREVSQFLRDGQIGLRAFVKELNRVHPGSRKRARRRK